MTSEFENTLRRSTRSVAEIEEWLCQVLMETLHIPRSAVDVNASFTAYGLDSAALIGFTEQLSVWLGEDVDPTLLYDYPNIRALSQALGKDGAPP
jgi:acyl carrier protein